MTKREYHSSPLLAFSYDSIAFAYDLYSSPAWREVEGELNPWDDPDLQVLVDLQFTARVLKLVHGQEFFPIYWSALRIEDQLIAAAKHSYYADLESRVIQLIREYCWNEYFAPNEDVIMTRFDNEIANGKIADRMLEKHKERLKEKHLNDQFARSQAAAGGYVMIADMDWIGTRYTSALHVIPVVASSMGTVANRIALNRETREFKLTPLILSPVSDEVAKMLATYRERGAALQVEIGMSYSNLLFDLSEMAKRRNKLSGKAATTEALLTNDDIPVPTQETFLGWLSIAGLSFIELPKPIKLRGGVGKIHRYTHALTYTSPTMPVTPEHLNHNSASIGVTGVEDSFAKHSLNYRSPGHIKDAHGDVFHGLGQCETVLLDITGESKPHLVTADWASECSEHSIVTVIRHFRQISELSLKEIRANQVLVKFMGDWEHLHGLIQTYAFDPWRDGSNLLAMGWGLGRLNNAPDTGYRSMSQFNGLHLRFDSHEHHVRWSNAFAETAIQWLNTPADTAAGLLARRNAESKVRRVSFNVRSKNGKYEFDISGL